jgi:hypothetical protein
MKISDHKVSYITKTDIDEFARKIQIPPSQKKAPEYKGKKFELADDIMLSDGGIIILGQNWGGKLNAITGERELAYKDIIGFHFSKTGVLLSQFGVDTKENNADYPTPQAIVESNDNKSAYWLIAEVKGMKGEGKGFQIAGISTMSSYLKKRLLTYPTMGKIDLNSSKVTEIKAYGEGKYFLDNNFQFIELTDENKLVFFGADKSGNTIWFCRIILK